MTPPIKQCFNGHNICKDCRRNVENCPVCRGNLADIRNLTAVSMSRLITHSCVNKKFGCTGQFCWISRSNTKRDVCSDLFVTRIKKAKDGKYKQIFNFDSNAPEITSHKYEAVEEFGEVFFAMVWENVCNFDYIGHFYLGEEDEARKFRYKVTLTSQDGNETMSSYRLCRSYLSLNNVLHTDNKKYDGYFSTFPKRFVDRCFDSNKNLTYDFEILQT
ncbi:hypothetical protein C0J52_27169 [Blattella germanica]|nr:hypothetical protein C0J52_27169 [Blattella germanica]